MSVAKSKLLLFGEHSAVYGYPALGIPLPWTVKVKLTPAEETTWATPPLSKEQQEMLNRLILPYKAHIQVTSDIPIGVGLGSSAALCVALARAMTSENVWECAHQLEGVFHKKPSGIDTGLSFHERVCYFRGKEEGLPDVEFLEEFSLPLVIGALRRTSDTASLIEGIAHHKNARYHLQALGEIAQEAREFQQIGKLADEAHQHLSSLELSTPELDFMLERGKAFGALGGKLSGAGGGGAYFLVAPSFEEGERIAAKLRTDPKVQKLPHKLFPQVLQEELLLQ